MVDNVERDPINLPVRYFSAFMSNFYRRPGLFKTKPLLLKQKKPMIKNGLFFFVFFLFFLHTGLHAQVFSGGVTAGLVGSQVAGDNFSGYNKAGIFAGGFVAMRVGNKSSLQMELTYFQKGSRENPREKNRFKSLIYRLNYVEIPLLYQYQAGRFIIEAGPSAGVLTGYYEEANQEIISDDPGYVKPAGLTFQINVGLAYKASPNWFFMIRTNDSLWNIRSQNVTGDVFRFWDYGQYNDALVLGVRYVFGKTNR